MPQLTKFLVWLSLFVLWAGGVLGQAAAGDRITIEGTPAMQRMVESVIAEFRQLHPDVDVDLRISRSELGIRAVVDGSADLGLTDRELTELERTNAPTLSLECVALEAMAIAVHPRNPVDRVFLGQLARLYSGRLTAWRELGGRDEPVELVGRPTTDPSCRWFLACIGLMLDEAAPARPDCMTIRRLAAGKSVDVPVRALESSDEILAWIQAHPRALGYVPLNDAVERAAREGLIKLLDLENVIATVENVTEAGYAFHRPLCVVSPPEPRPIVRRLLNFLQGAPGHRILLRLGYVPARRLDPQ